MLEYLDYLRLIVVAIAAIVFLISTWVPFWGTFIPYWKQFGKPSEAMIFRLLVRFFLFLLALYNLTFPAVRVIGINLNLEAFRTLAIPIYLVLLLLVIHGWFNHPDRIKGL